MVLPYTVRVQAEDAAALVFKEDYQSISVGGKPTYGASNWTGDTASSHPECKVGVVDEHGNRSFLMQYTGTGAAVTADPLIYRNLNIGKDEKQTFYMRVKTDDTNRYKQIFLRSSSGSKLELFSFTGSSVYIVGMATSDIKQSTWYDLKFVFSGAEKAVDIYVNGTYGGTAYMKAWDITNMSLRATIMGATTAGMTTNLYIDNVAQTQGDMQVEFDEPEYSETTPEPENPGAIEENTTLPNSDAVVFCIDNSKVYAGGSIKDTGIKTVVNRGNTLIPARNLATVFDGTIEWNNEGAYAALNVNNNEVKLYNGKLEINGSETECAVKPQNLSGRMYVSAETAGTITGRKTDIKDNGAVVLYPETENESNISTILKRISFSEPKAEQILEDFKKYNPDGVHPRILMDGDRLSKIKELLKTNDRFITWYQRVKKEADTALKNPISTYELRDGERLLYVSRDVMSNVIYPAFVYLIEGKREYLERAVAELDAAAKFPDWHPTHFLDTAEMTLAFAIGYDWLYDSLSTKQKKTLRTAILRLGLDAANEAYEGTAAYDSNVAGAAHNRMGWRADPSNWGLVCNGGIAAGACAVIGDEESEYCAEIISKALKSAETPLSLFAPDGAWSEGIGYWSYACNYLSYLISSVKNTTGTDYGYTMVPGILATANFPVYLTGPKGSFNYGDASEGSINAPVLFWFANELNEAGLNDTRLSMMDKFNYQGNIYDILFYNPDMPQQENVMEKDKKFRITEVAVATNSTANTNANYIGIKGGKVGTSHGDLDAGVFMIDAIGARWTVDFGTDDYNLPGYFFWPQRADYYRKRAEGHCTLVLNPDGTPDQIPGASTYISDFISGDGGNCSVVDMSAAYAKNAKSVKRAAVLYDDRSKMMIQDEVVAEKPTDVYWFMQTQMQDITVAPDGKSLVISDGNSLASGKRLKLILQSNCRDAKFSYGPAEPLPQSPKGAGQASNTGACRIQVKSPNVTNLNMQVIFVPYLNAEGKVEPDLPALKSIQELTENKNIDFNAQSYAYLDDLKVNGKTVSFFDPCIQYYSVDVTANDTEMPVTEASSSQFEVQIQNARQIGEPTAVTVTDPTGKFKTRTYYITQNIKRLVADRDPSWKEIKATGVEASEVVESQNTPENTIDGDNTTKWAANRKQWIKYDLGSEKTVDAVGLLWMNAASRVQKYSVEVSKNGTDWTTVFDGNSLRVSDDMEYLVTSHASARYIRVTVSGTNTSTWTSLMETKFFVQ